MKPITLSPGQLRAAEVLFWLALASSFFLAPDHLTLLSQILIFGLFAVALDQFGARQVLLPLVLMSLVSFAVFARAIGKRASWTADAALH